MDLLTAQFGALEDLAARLTALRRCWRTSLRPSAAWEKTSLRPSVPLEDDAVSAAYGSRAGVIEKGLGSGSGDAGSGTKSASRPAAGAFQFNGCGKTTLAAVPGKHGSGSAVLPEAMPRALHDSIPVQGSDQRWSQGGLCGYVRLAVRSRDNTSG